MNINLHKEVIEIAGEELTLLPQKAIKWKNMLWLADLHLGKIRHFRKSGIPVPESASRGNFENLIQLITTENPESVLFLGDLFHSHYNDDFEIFSNIIKSFPQVEFHLIPGNHDTISAFRFEELNIKIHPGKWKKSPFIFTHEPLEHSAIPEYTYNICGHMHPVAVLKGSGKQQLQLPCFYFSKTQGYLPAFGIFTGNFRLKPQMGDRVYLITPNKIISK